VILAISGMAIVLAASLALYLASPQQRLTKRAVPRAAYGWGGLTGLVVGLIVLWQWAGPATAVFIAMTLATLIWTIVPPAAAWLGRPKEEAR